MCELGIQLFSSISSFIINALDHSATGPPKNSLGEPKYSNLFLFRLGYTKSGAELYVYLLGQNFISPVEDEFLFEQFFTLHSIVLTQQVSICSLHQPDLSFILFSLVLGQDLNPVQFQQTIRRPNCFKDVFYVPSLEMPSCSLVQLNRV